VALHRPHDLDPGVVADVDKFFYRCNDRILRYVVELGQRHAAFRIAEAVLHVDDEQCGLPGYDGDLGCQLGLLRAGSRRLRRGSHCSSATAETICYGV
jgi:hypothetical protein